MEIDSLAHEIINPLNIIIGCAELSKMESISNPVSNNINEIIKQSLWCCQLLKAELEARQNSNYIDLYFFLEDIIDDIGNHPLLKLKNINLVLIENLKIKNIPQIHINKVYLKIVINNLLLNAIKYGKPNCNIEIELISDNNIIEIDINNFIDENPKSSYFNKSNSTGLNVINRLTEKMSCKWDLLQDKSRIKSRLICPIV